MPPEDESLWVSPADGRVMEIGPAEHPFTGPALCIGIFMSPLDVHVNRSPAGGTIEFLDYVPGKRLAAYHPKASMENERFYAGWKPPGGRRFSCKSPACLQGASPRGSKEATF
jgi:Phosphatidylserine decarboxylase